MNRTAGMHVRTARTRIMGFTLTAVVLTACGGGGGSGSAMPPPVVTLSLSSQIVPVGQSATLTWSATEAQSCTALLSTYSGNTADAATWAGSVPTSGTKTLTPSAADYYTYDLTCTGTGATGSGSTVLTVSSPTPTELANEGT